MSGFLEDEILINELTNFIIAPDDIDATETKPGCRQSRRPLTVGDVDSIICKCYCKLITLHAS